MRSISHLSWHTAMTGQWPQEGPQLVAAQLPHSAPPAEVLPIFPAKADKSRSAFFDPHFGQTMAALSSRLRKRTSKGSPHFRHLNSKIGIGLSPPSDRNIPPLVAIAEEERPWNFVCCREIRRNPRKCQDGSHAVLQHRTAMTGPSSLERPADEDFLPHIFLDRGQRS